MNWVDLAVIGIIALSAVFAFARGFVREALSIVAWVGAAFVTIKGFEWAFARIEPYVHNPLLSRVIAGFGLFVVSLVVLTMITGTLARLVNASFLTPIDRTLGFIFGLVRGALLVCLAYLLLELMVPQPNDQPPWIREARSAPYLHAGADMLKGFVPESLKNKAAEDMMKSLAPSPATQAEEAKNAPAKPTAPKAEATPAAPSYPNAERRQLDRVIGNQR